MIKLVDLLKEITEAKQVGTIYHYTKNLLKIIQTNTLKANPTPDIKDPRNFINCVSFTRTPHRTFWIAKDSKAVLVIDGDKLSNKYKISPYNDWIINHEDEMEERTCGRDITNIDQYIIKVILYEDNDEIKSLLKSKNIPYEIEKKLLNFTNWRFPTPSQRKQEFKIEQELKDRHFWDSEEDFQNAVRYSKQITITPEEDQNIYDRSRTKSYDELLNLIQSYRSYPGFRNEETLQSIYDGFKNNKPMDMPIVMEFNDGSRRIFSGNTRMDIAFQLGINPKVLLINSKTY
jgi:hypothetical protein